GLPDDVRAAKDDGVLAGDLDLTALQELHDSCRRGRHEGRVADQHTTHIFGMESIYILRWIDGVDDLFLVDVIGEGELDEDAVHRVVGVQALDDGKQLRL